MLKLDELLIELFNSSSLGFESKTFFSQSFVDILIPIVTDSTDPKPNHVVGDTDKDAIKAESLWRLKKK